VLFDVTTRLTIVREQAGRLLEDYEQSPVAGLRLPRIRVPVRPLRLPLRGRRPLRSSAGTDTVADLDRAGAYDVGAKAAAVDQARHRRLPDQAGEIRAWLAKPHPAKYCLSDLELAADEVVQRHAAGDHVAASRAGLDDDAALGPQCADGLQLDERHVAAGSWLR
jgi:hypothetical protein